MWLPGWVAVAHAESGQVEAELAMGDDGKVGDD
jgi:hypothetical protein